LSYLKLRNDGFHIARNLIDAHTFRDWWKSDGKAVQYDMMLRIRARWFFGARRVRRRLFRAARRVFDPVAPFALELEQHLDDLPSVVGKIGLAIRKRGHRDFYTTEKDTAVIVIPRGIVRNDYEVRLVKLLSDSPHASAFPGLARRIVRHIADEAEELLFESLSRARDPMDAGERALLLGVDPAFRWRINGTDGHYYMAWSNGDEDISSRRARKRFRAAAEEVRNAHEEFLRNMGSKHRNAAARPFQLTH
jgi:hypothetical protein